MSEFNPKQGEMILVGVREMEREFVAMDGKGHICREIIGGGYVFWVNAKPLPVEPEPTPFTHETWPMQLVWLKHNTDLVVGPKMVVGMYDSGVQTRDRSMGFRYLSENYLMSLDFCQTWQPCHHVPNPTE